VHDKSGGRGSAERRKGYVEHIRIERVVRLRTAKNKAGVCCKEAENLGKVDAARTGVLRGNIRQAACEGQKDTRWEWRKKEKDEPDCEANPRRSKDIQGRRKSASASTLEEAGGGGARGAAYKDAARLVA